MSLFGLLAANGVRISEALTLQLDDVTTDGLVIRQTKFQKSLLLPLHRTTWSPLDQYFGGPSPRRDLEQRAVRFSRRHTAVLPTIRWSLSSFAWRDRSACAESSAKRDPAFLICGIPSPCAP
ncbi:hypothetical protein [Mesorhizobium intechi]|uniref:hypothetical protein n=1 Tax=Mesorhizobium intechi TaxID=537601 RepID=UPI001FE67CB4|nr:hypothetical protein [Mesorhizobium intechi]